MIKWSYYTIPTIVFFTNIVVFLSIGAKLSPRDVVFYFLLINLYMFGIAFTSRFKERYLVVFLPWTFLPTAVLFFSTALGNFGVAFTVVFMTSLAMEYLCLGDVSIPIFTARSFVMFMVFWELKGWLRSLLVSYVAR